MNGVIRVSRRAGGIRLSSIGIPGQKSEQRCYWLKVEIYFLLFRSNSRVCGYVVNSDSLQSFKRIGIVHISIDLFGMPPFDERDPVSESRGWCAFPPFR